MPFNTQSTQAILPRRIGEQFVKRVSRAFHSTPWYLTLLNLAWTAGPVTYLALQGGHYLSFGKAVAPGIFMYFAGYTVIAGVLAGFASLIRHMVLEPRRERVEQLLLNAVERLFLLYHSVRNEYLNTYPREEQAVIAAWWSCRSAATDVDVLEEAIRDVTGDDGLAHAMKRVEHYRRQGFVDLMRQEYTQHAEKITSFVATLSPKYPGLAQHIQNRFEGNAPSLRFGQERPAGFIERLIIMEENDSLQMATPDDVVAMIHLTLELLLGRRVIALYPRFNGYKRLDESREAFDALLSDFRLLLRKRNGRMRAMIMDITMHQEDADGVQVVGASSAQLSSMLTVVLQQNVKQHIGRRRYQKVVQMNDQLHQLWKKLSQQERHYNKIWKQYGDKLKAQLQSDFAPKKRHNALVIREHEIVLSHKQKIDLAALVHEILDEAIMRKKGAVTGMSSTDSALLAMDDYKKLASQFLDALDDMINISEPAEQLAVEASREADFGCVEPGLASQTKLGWGRIMVEEVQQDRMQIAHRLAALLIRYFNVPLGGAIIDYLVREYGASREYLNQLQADESDSIELATDRLRSELLTLPKWESICA